MSRVKNIKWETDGYDVKLPTWFEIPERFCEDDSVDEDAVSDWISKVTGWSHNGFEIKE